MSVCDHKKNDRAVKCALITVSDTRTSDTDKSGQLMNQMLLEAQIQVNHYMIVPDDFAAIQCAVTLSCDDQNVDAVLLNGGTGVSPRDITIETVEPMLDKLLPGFGEVFRMLSYQEDIGSAAILSRAIAGIRGHTSIFSIPGSSGAVKLAMKRLIIPELTHIVNEAQKNTKND